VADGSVTIDGLDAFKKGVAQLPAKVTARLRAVAWRTSRQLKDRAKANLLARRNAPRTAESIVIVDESDRRKKFTVKVLGDPTRPKMLPIWLEYGTVHMAGAHYLVHAIEAEVPGYLKDMEQAAIVGAEEALG
jgi:hypothetical protein